MVASCLNDSSASRGKGISFHGTDKKKCYGGAGGTTPNEIKNASASVISSI